MLIKGGHAEGEEMTDTLVFANGDKFSFTEHKIDSTNLHGTGCTLSSAIATYLAMDYQLPEAVHRAKNYLTEAIRAGQNQHIGQGNGPLGVMTSFKPDH